MNITCSVDDSDDDIEWPVTRTLAVTRIQGEQTERTTDEVIDEVPVAFVYNGISHAVMLASPADLRDFAIGFSLSEGIIERPAEIYDCDVAYTGLGIELRIELASERFFALKERRRALTGRTGCGLCGVDSLAAVARTEGRVSALSVSVAAMREALRALGEQQPLFAATGAVHAAGWSDLDGNVLAVREDVGRHNALDKLIGWRASTGHQAPGFFVVSSRASFEMVQKTVQAGVGCLVAVSAPTAMAVRLAEHSGLTLVGFARGARLVGYAGWQGSTPVGI